MSPFIAEVVGTFVLIGLGHSINANVSLKGTYGKGSGWIVITIGWGLAVFCGVTVAAPYSGAHINPAVTLGLAMAGAFAWADVLPFMGAQMLGAALGAGLVWVAFRNHFNLEENPDAKLGVFATGPAIKSYPDNFLSEMIGTFFLMFVILYITGPDVEAAGTTEIIVGLGSIGALPVAFLVMVIGMGFGGLTGYAINPARDLAPRMMHAILPIKGKRDSNWSYAWIPVLAPLAGACAACVLHFLIS
ncbi:MAG: MIP/aquaporin family protein [Cyclobacteriaceae bacterium]